MSNNSYYKTTLKRNFKSFPPIFISIVAILLIFAIIGAVTFNMLSKSDYKKKVNIGLVGNSKGSYLGLGIDSLSKYDSLRFEMKFISLSEKEAKEQLLNKSLACYIVIPDNFVDDLIDGNNPHLDYVTTDSETFLGAAIIRDVTVIVAKCLSECEAGIYSMHKIAIDNNISDEKISDGDIVMSEKYINFVLERSNGFSPQILGISDGVSTEGYYFCAILFLFLMIFGVFYAKILFRKKQYFIGYLKSKGIGIKRQIFCEYFSYFTVSALTLFFFCLVGSAVLGFLKLNLIDFAEINMVSGILFFIKLIPILLMITAFQFLLFEAIGSECAAVLAQFMSAIVFAYLGGCFYPINFFPTYYQKLVNYLPNGAGFSYIRQCFSGQFNVFCFLTVLAYFVLFIGISIAIRSKRIGKTGD